MRDLDTTVAAYLEALAAADVTRALRVLEDELDRGIPFAQLVADVISPAQRRLGELWYVGSYGVADEHAATTVAEQVLAILSPHPRAAGTAKTVLLACADGEWHTFPARLATALNGDSASVRVLQLGGSISADHLRRYLRNAAPDALAVSTTLTTHLIGAARSIRAGCEEGVPVIVGGRAWGGSQERARRLGANLYLRDASELAAALAECAGPRPVSELPVVPEEAILLDDPPEALLHQAHAQQLRVCRWLKTASARAEREALRDLRWIVRHAANAVACEDSSILGEHLDWQLGLATPRGTPHTVLLDGCLHLADAVESVAPSAASVLREQSGLRFRERPEAS